MRGSKLTRYLVPALSLGSLCCASVPKQSGLSKALESQVSRNELRAAENALAVSVPGEVQASCDEIIAQSADPQVRHRVLRYKIEVVSAYYIALFESDPLAAAFDVWALSLQLDRCIAEGPCKDWFGPLQPIAVTNARKVMDQVDTAMRSVAKRTEGYDKARQKVENWVNENPITSSIASRPSILPMLAQMSASPDQSVWEAVGDVTATLDDISTRLDIYAAYLPKAGRWQAELLFDDIQDRDEAQLTLAAIASVKKLTDQMNGLLGPDAIHEATSYAVAAFHTERVQTMAELIKMRDEAFGYLSGERQVALAAVDNERTKLLADVDRERSESLRQMNELSRQTFANIERMANRIILRATVALGVLLFLTALLAVAVARSAMRRGGPAPPG
jgi:hypothetical protein